MGTAPVEREGRTRHVFVYGVSSSAPAAWKMAVRSGSFLEPTDWRYGSPHAVLGPTVKRELFEEESPLGKHVRIGGQRFLVVGVMESKGQFLGFDIDDAVYIPVALAQPLFNRDDLQEIDVLVRGSSAVDSVVARIHRSLLARHNGQEDFTITTQTGMLETLDRVVRIVSLAVVGIGAISLLVGAIGILTMMWISVSERTAEIGLVKALGATPVQILSLFLAEATFFQWEAESWASRSDSVSLSCCDYWCRASRCRHRCSMRGSRSWSACSLELRAASCRRAVPRNSTRWKLWERNNPCAVPRSRARFGHGRGITSQDDSRGWRHGFVVAHEALGFRGVVRR